MDKRWLPVLVCLPTLTQVVRLIALNMHASLLEELEPQLPIIALLKKRMPYSIDTRSTLHYVDKTSQTVCNWPQQRLTNTCCHVKMLMKLWSLISGSTLVPDSGLNFYQLAGEILVRSNFGLSGSWSCCKWNQPLSQNSLSGSGWSRWHPPWFTMGHSLKDLGVSLALWYLVCTTLTPALKK
jgi:hypothetical protein